jgi:hypothetical protein
MRYQCGAVYGDQQVRPSPSARGGVQFMSCPQQVNTFHFA